MVSLGLVLLIAACSTPATPGQGSAALTHHVISNDPGPDFQAVMTQIGIDYAAELSWHDPQRVITPVEQCYRDSGAFQGIKGENDTRRCLAMDYAAYKDNQIATHNYRMPGIPYFNEDAAAQRWTIYGPRAGFTSADAMFQYMRGAYAFIHPTQVAVTRSRTPPAGAVRPMTIAPNP
jgi:hypothetical protein